MKIIQTYHVLKATEGGLGQRQALLELKELGIKAVGSTSCYVGHTAVIVTGTKEQHKKVVDLLFH
jgi:polyribonucleotide nucleotidyltransferase